MDKGEGVTIYDSSGNGNNGTLTLGSLGQTSAGSVKINANTAWYNGRVGKQNYSLNFDGSDDKISALDINKSRSSKGSISYWLYIDEKDISNGPFHLYERGHNASDYIRNYIDGGNRIDLLIEDDDTTKIQVYYDLDNLGDFTEQWLHFLWLQDGTGVKLYINNKEKILSGSNSGDWWTSHLIEPIDLYISYSWYYFNGKIDEVKIYNYAITADQIKTEYNFGSARLGTGN